MEQATYPVQFSVDYPDRPLDRVSTGFRIFAAIPILIVMGALSRGSSFSGGGTNLHFSASTSSSFGLFAGGLLVLAPLLMILFRQKYPRWWFDWNLQMLRFTNRVGVYLALMDDRYPSTDEEQSVHLDFPYPDATRLNRWLPLVKWLLAIPHWIILAFLSIAAFFVLIWVWFVILFTGRYPRNLFDFLEGVFRWNNRVAAYALIMVTDEYPPFRFEP